MRSSGESMIEIFARRSSFALWGLTIFMAMADTLLALSTGPGFVGRSSTSCVWIPFCFISIPTIHYLCRELVRLRQRVADLENKLDPR